MNARTNKQFANQKGKKACNVNETIEKLKIPNYRLYQELSDRFNSHIILMRKGLGANNYTGLDY